MARNTIYYSQSKNSVVVSGDGGSRTIKDFAEGDSIEWAPNTGRITLTEGLDKSAISISSAIGGKITVTLKPTSGDAGYLNSLANRNRTQPTLLKVTIISGTEEQVVLTNAAVHCDGGTSGGASMSTRKFEFTGTELIHDESQG